MKILIVGDPHGSEKVLQIPVGKIKPDVIITPGDLGKADLARKFYFQNVERKKQNLPELEKNKKQLQAEYDEIFSSTKRVLVYLSKFANVYTLIGNVWRDCLSETKLNAIEKKEGVKIPRLKLVLKKLGNVFVVRNRVRRFGNLRVGFLENFTDECWTKEFGEKDKKVINKAKKDTKKARKILKNFGRVDILVCHQPPYGILDKVTAKYAPKHWQGKHAGSKVILDYVKKFQPKYVICGHIHEGKGHKKVGKTLVINTGFNGDY